MYRDAGVWAALVDTLEQLTGPHTLVVLAHGSGAAPGVLQMRGDFYDKCAAVFAPPVRAPAHALAAAHPAVQLHFLARRPGPRPGAQGRAGGGDEAGRCRAMASDPHEGITEGGVCVLGFDPRGGGGAGLLGESEGARTGERRRKKQRA